MTVSMMENGEISIYTVIDLLLEIYANHFIHSQVVMYALC
jgi:hypothetical protein